MLTRIKLASYGVLISWVLNTLGEFVCRLAWGSGDSSPGLALFTAPVYLVTYIFFAVPIAACCRAEQQLRFWYLLVVVSLGWAALMTSLLFHASLREMLTPWPSPLFLIWFCECALVSMTCYLLLLRQAVKRVHVRDLAGS